MKMTKKQMIIAGVVVGMLAVGGGTVAYQSHATTVNAKTAIKAEQKDVKDFEKQVQALFANEKKDFLAKDLKQETVTKLGKRIAAEQKAVQEISDVKAVKHDVDAALSKLKTLSADVKAASDKLSIQSAVNGLFAEAVLNGNSVKKDAAIKEKLEQKTIDAINVKAIKADDWTKAVSELKTSAANQLKDIDAANKAVDELEKDQNNDKLKSAQDAANKVKVKSTKDSLDKRINAVKAALDKKAADEKAKAEAQANTQTEGQTVQQASNEESYMTAQVPEASNSSSNNSASTGSNQPSTPSPTPSAPSNNGGGSSSPSTPAPQAPTPAPAPQAPAQTIKWFVIIYPCRYEDDGSITELPSFRKDGFSSEAEADAWAMAYCKSNNTQGYVAGSYYA